MNRNEVILVAVKNRVLAVSKPDGRTLWSSDLPSGMGQAFVTVLSDDRHVFAHTHGKLHCLDLASGRVLWTNELPGCGYGLASLCLPGGTTAPDTAAAQHLFASQQAAASATAASTAL